MVVKQLPPIGAMGTPIFPIFTPPDVIGAPPMPAAPVAVPQGHEVPVNPAAMTTPAAPAPVATAEPASEPDAQTEAGALLLGTVPDGFENSLAYDPNLSNRENLLMISEVFWSKIIYS